MASGSNLGRGTEVLRPFESRGRSPGNIRPLSLLTLPEEITMSQASRAYPEPGTFKGADDEIYTVKPLSINGMVKIEEQYGFESIEEAFDTKRLELHKPKKLRWMLCTILQEAHEEMTEEKAGKIINVANLREAQAAVVWAFTAAVPTSGDEEEEESSADPSGKEKERVEAEAPGDT